MYQKIQQSVLAYKKVRPPLILLYCYFKKDKIHSYFKVISYELAMN